MNYFDPTLGGESHPDPYIDWQLLKTAEEEEAREARDHVQSSDDKREVERGSVIGSDKSIEVRSL